jgi:hypothetical protein
MVNFITAVLLILFAAFSRLIPHPMNFAPIAAIALFSSVYLNKKSAFIIPVAAMIISDAILGFYAGIEWVYGSFVLIALIGLWLKKRVEGAGAGKKTAYVAGTTIVSSMLFFVLTNFGVWLSGMFYEMSFKGLLQCYTMAIPFFRNTLAGDLVFTGAMFVIYESIIRFARSSDIQTSRVRK